jgi:transposase
MPRPHPPEFRQRAIELAREGTSSIGQIARDLGISESCLRNWLARSDVDEGRREGLTSDERVELVKLRRENRVLRMEKEILGKAAAFFATENGHRPS